MHRLIITFFTVLMSAFISAQEIKPFDVTISNDDYKIYMRLNLHGKNILVPEQEMLGEMDGYIGSSQSRNKWFIVSSQLIGKNIAEIEIINDYGSEDIKATIKLNADGTYTFNKKSGSTLKFGVKGKWQKLPANITLKRKK